MTHTRSYRLSLAALLCLLLPACGSSGSNANSTLSTLQWDLMGLETLGAGYEYEGWIIVGGAPVSTGRFNVDSGGMPTTTSAAIPAATAAQATAFVLTIEPTPDPDPGPSATKILGGDFTGGMATVGIGHPAALGDDFTAAMGSFIVATPSTTVMTDENQGIWWLNPANGTGTLQLPVLPAGWAYEGWVVGTGGPASTGRFTDPAGPDADLAGPTGGLDSNGPPFPGQDFINPAMVIVGSAAVITIEPEPDDAPGPFTMKPLLTPSISGDLAPTLQSMNNNAAATNPTGTVTIN